jgi:phosphohistidine phosphatase
MRRLILLRHAKSARPPGVADADRPLAPEGRQAAPRMGAYLRDEGLFPDLALVSSSRRTRETWDLAGAPLGDVEVRFDPRIYEAPAERLLTVLRETEPEVQALLMVGHNPGFEDLARRLVGHGDRSAQADLAKSFPTSAVAVIDFAVEAWDRVAFRGGRLDRLVTPKSLGAGEDD